MFSWGLAMALTKYYLGDLLELITEVNNENKYNAERNYSDKS